MAAFPGFTSLRRFLRFVIGRSPNKADESNSDKPIDDAQCMPWPVATDECKVEELPGAVRQYECGHAHSRRYVLVIYGETVALERDGYAQNKICGRCLLAKVMTRTIRCAICGFGIGAGHGVALCSDTGTFKPEWTTRAPNGRVIACLRMDCCPSGSFFAGHWTGDHYKPAHQGDPTSVVEVVRMGPVVLVSDGDQIGPAPEESEKKN